MSLDGATDTVELRGVVAAGRGMATGHIQEEYPAFKAALGTDIHPGTLNVVLDGPVRLDRSLARVTADEHRLMWPARLNDHPVWFYRFAHAPLHIVEIIAVEHLRGALGLKDGDPVVIEIPRMCVAPLSTVERIGWAALWAGRRGWYYRKDGYAARTRRLSIDIGATQMPRRRGMIDAMRGFVRRGFT